MRRACLVLGAALLMLLLSVVASAPSGAATLDNASNWGATPSSPCNALDPSGCMLPFPSDYYTVASSSTVTGRQIYFPPGALPPPTGGAAPDVAPWEQNDGFSPGSTVLTHVKGISLSKTGVATISDIGNSLSKDTPIVLFDATSRKLWPTWTELDVNDSDPNTQLLMIHPARDLAEGHRYIVALRGLRNSAGRLISAPPAFGSSVLGRTYHVGFAPLSQAYSSHLRGDVRSLSRDGLSTAHLYLAWDFTIASRQNLTSPALDMRNEVFVQLGSGVPSFTVTKIVNDPPGLPSLEREITGTFDVPSFLTGPAGVSGTELETGPNGAPQESGLTEVAAFDCEIPKAATTRPAHVGIYGHGLFGSSIEVYASAVPQFSNRYDYVFCGTDWYGLSSNSLVLATSVVSNFGDFPSLADSLLQSLLDAQVLGRLMDDSQGFASSPAFQSATGRSLIDPGSGLVYYGNSEGGIMGGAFTALSTDVHKAVLGVTGMDYALLLSRSADFSPFQGVLNSSYPSKATQQVGFDVVQMLWDRAETDGYVEQMTSGLPGTPRHQVMLEEGFGDHQVANISTEDEARTIGATVREPILAKGRSGKVQPFWDLPATRAGSKGPALTVWDSGVPRAPLSDRPPTRGPDPHDTIPRTLPAFWRQMNTFFTTGRVTNTCGNAPCKAPYPSGS